MRSYTWEDVRRIRLAKAHLSHRTDRTIAQVASDVGGIHAQVLSAAEQSLAIRMRKVEQQDIHDALWKKRTVVKAWTHRGTLHLVAAGELPRWIAARHAVAGGFHPRTLEFHGISRAQADAITHAIGEALDGECLLRADLADAVTKKVGEWARAPLMSGWGTMMGEAVLRGWVCHGPPRGNTITFTRADQWVRSWKAQDPEESLRWVATRYLKAFGPATTETFRAWFNGLAFRPKDARRVFEELGSKVEQVEVEGKAAWMLKADKTEPVDPPRVHIMPLYDCFIVGFREREEILTEAAIAYAKTHPKGKLEGPVAVKWLLIDGRVAGTWEKAAKGKKVEFTATTFARPSKPIKDALRLEAERLAAFWGQDLKLTIDTR